MIYLISASLCPHGLYILMILKPGSLKIQILKTHPRLTKSENVRAGPATYISLRWLCWLQRSIWEPLVPVSFLSCLTSYLCHNPQQWFPHHLFIEICLAYITNELLTVYVHGLVYTLSYFPLCGMILLASPYFLKSLSLGFWQYSLLVYSLLHSGCFPSGPLFPPHLIKW